MLDAYVQQHTYKVAPDRVTCTAHRHGCIAPGARAKGPDARARVYYDSTTVLLLTCLPLRTPGFANGESWRMRLANASIPSFGRA